MAEIYDINDHRPIYVFQKNGEEHVVEEHEIVSYIKGEHYLSDDILQMVVEHWHECFSEMVKK